MVVVLWWCYDGAIIGGLDKVAGAANRLVKGGCLQVLPSHIHHTEISVSCCS